MSQSLQDKRLQEDIRSAERQEALQALDAVLRLERETNGSENDQPMAEHSTLSPELAQEVSDERPKTKISQKEKREKEAKQNQQKQKRHKQVGASSSEQERRERQQRKQAREEKRQRKRRRRERRNIRERRSVLHAQ